MAKRFVKRDSTAGYDKNKIGLVLAARWWERESAELPARPSTSHHVEIILLCCKEYQDNTFLDCGGWRLLIANPKLIG